MELIVWDDSLITGISLIDAQHKVLINKLNKLNADLKENKVDNNINMLLDELLEYTYYHFETEEEFFEKYSYSGKAEHLKEHETFRNYLNNFLLKKNENKEIPIKDLMNFLKKWIEHHIKKVDMEYVEFLKEKI